MNIYKELKDRHQRELDKFPFFFAFNDKQFEDGKKKLGVTDNNELYIGAGCMIYHTGAIQKGCMIWRFVSMRKWKPQ